MSVVLLAADYWMPYLLVQPVDTMALKGRTVALQCSAASSVEHVSIHWRKNNVALHETPHKITVSAATPLSPPHQPLPNVPCTQILGTFKAQYCLSTCILPC